MKKIVIVDDAAFIRAALRKILESNGFEVLGEAGDGVEAIEQCRKLKPDIVTLDITMPNMNGIEALQIIQQMDPKCKVIMVSALGQESYIKEAVLKGAKNFIVKPFKEDTIVNTLNKFI